MKESEDMKKILLISLLLAVVLVGCSKPSQGIEPVVKPQEMNGEVISIDDAMQLAVTHQNLAINDVTFTKVQFDKSTGNSYDIEFTNNGLTYAYAVDANMGTILTYNVLSSTGEVISNSQPVTPSAPTNNSTGEYITKEKAQEIALKHAGLNASDVQFARVEVDYENNIRVYEVEFYTNDGREYDYEIHATSGVIVGYDYDAEYYAPTSVKPTHNISAADAKAIALKHAGVSASNIYGYKCELDYDDGRAEYEIEFRVGNVEYDYEIDASTGKIISYEIDRDYD